MTSSRSRTKTESCVRSRRLACLYDSASTRRRSRTSACSLSFARARSPILAVKSSCACCNSAFVRRCVPVIQATSKTDSAKTRRYHASSIVTGRIPDRGPRMKWCMDRSERPTANKPGPMPPYQALTMIAGMNGVPRIPGRFSTSVASNASATLAPATPYRSINQTEVGTPFEWCPPECNFRRRLQMAPLICAAQEERLEAGGPLTSVTGPEHSAPSRTTPRGALLALLVVLTTRPPLPPFTQESAAQKVRLAEDGWNSRDPEKVALAYTPDSRWRNRSEFVNGRPEIIAFLARKWNKELDYRSWLSAYA